MEWIRVFSKYPHSSISQLAVLITSKYSICFQNLVNSLAEGMCNLPDTSNISNKIIWNSSFLPWDLHDLRVIYFFILLVFNFSCSYSLKVIELFIIHLLCLCCGNKSTFFFVTKFKNVLDWFRSDRWHAPDCVQNNLVVTLSKWSEYAYLDQSDWIITIHFTVTKISFPRTAPCGFILQTRLEKMLHCSYTWQLYFPVFNFAKLKRNSGSCLSHKTLLGLSPGKFFHYNVPKECKKKKNEQGKHSDLNKQSCSLEIAYSPTGYNKFYFTLNLNKR